MIDCDYCREGARDSRSRALRSGIGLVALMAFIAIMLVHVLCGGDMSGLALFALGGACVLFVDFAVWFIDDFRMWRHWRRGDMHVRK